VRAVVWTAIAISALVQIMSTERLFSLDAGEAAFTALLPAAELLKHCRSVVIMHHKRLPELEATLRRLAELPGAPRLVVTVTQSLRPSEAIAANATGALLQSLAPALGMSLRHRPSTLPEHEVDGSYSVDAQRYGTKRNSFRNMLRGLHEVFDGDGAAPAYAIIMEDDVEVSEDALDFFDFSASLIDATRALPPPDRIALASTFCIPRRGHVDYGYKGWLPGDWAALRSDRYRRWALRDVTFKTFAWLASRKVYEAMVRDVEKSMLHMPAGSALPLHASLQGCPYCENFCYDHYLEWRWRNESFVCPEVPRARQYVIGGGGGMTEQPGAATDSYHGRERSGTLLNDDFVHRWQFVDGGKLQRGRRVLNSLALWLGPALALLVVWETMRCCGRNKLRDGQMPAAAGTIKGSRLTV